VLNTTKVLNLADGRFRSNDPLAHPGDWADDKKELMFVKVVTSLGDVQWLAYPKMSSSVRLW
jgi:hypothetical protein